MAADANAHHTPRSLFCTSGTYVCPPPSASCTISPMNRLFASFPTAIALVLLATCPALAQSRQVLNFNPAWRFIKEDVQGAQSPDFDDAKWASVSCPHTYNDVDTF